MSEPPTNWDRAEECVRRERLAVIRRVIELQREAMLLEGKELTADELNARFERG